MGFRITFLIGASTLAYFALIGNIFNLQVSKGDYYTARAASYSSKGAIEPERGSIYITDKKNVPIPAAINKEYPTIFADTRKVESPESSAGELSRLINKPISSLLPILKKPNDAYEPILKRASDKVASEVKAAKIPGIYVEYESSRYYPFNTLAAQVLGFVSKDAATLNKPLYGSELFYNQNLAGSAGGDNSSFKGEDVHLTIDRNIQAEGERLLKDLVSIYKAEGGSFIVSDPKTGKVLGMASYPSFDPNNYEDYRVKDFLNPAIQAIYEPGSIIKLVTIAAGLDAGVITPETAFNDSGSVTLNKRTIRNFDNKVYGRTSMTGVIEHSINTGAVYAQRLMGKDLFHDYLVRFGFNKKTGIDLPGEVVGSLRSLGKDARDINFATASFGQGMSVTPISLITAISAIANKGIMMKPSINAKTPPEILGQVISEDTARKVSKMMVTAVNTNVVGKIEGYNIAGKTGTAQVPDFKNGGYSDDVVNTYVGFAPAYNPKFIILFKLNKPAGAPQAGRTVVPAFKALTQFILNYYNIPPDNAQVRR